jgi:hypothetical protein
MAKASSSTSIKTTFGVRKGGKARKSKKSKGKKVSKYRGQGKLNR